MLGKLFKYDFKWIINKSMIVYFAITIIVTLITKFVETLEMTAIVTIIDKILVGILILCFFSTFITCLIRIWVRFNSNIYKDESYLTHTLPVVKSKIFKSKMLVSYLSIVMSIVVILGCIAIVFLNESTISFLKSMYNDYKAVFGESTFIGMIISTILIVILEVFYMMQCGIFGLVLGNRANNLKIVKSILIGLLCYVIISGVSLTILFIIAKFNPVIMELFTTDTPNMEAFKQLIYISLAMYFAYDVILYITSKKILEKGVNVD